MNIAIIMQSPDLGGAEEYMLSLAREFQKENKVFVASNKSKFLDKSRKLKSQTYEIPIILDINGNLRGLVKSILLLPYAFIFYSKLLLEFKRKKIDVILMSNFTEKLFVTFLSPFFKIPVVWIEYGRLETVFRRNFYIPKIVYVLLKNVPKSIIVPSENTKESLIKDAKVSPGKISLIPLGIGKKANKPRKHKGFIIGNISRLAKEKGQEYLIKALPMISKEVKDAKLWIVGDGPDRNYFEAIARKLNLGNRVKFFGFVQNKDDLYEQMDVFVFSTVWHMEGFGLASVEAMAHKLPVIAFNNGPVPEIVIDKKTGLLVKPKSEKELSESIIELAKNPNKRIYYGRNGYERFIEKYTLEKSATQVLDVLIDASIH